jgi:hypothetical protein
MYAGYLKFDWNGDDVLADRFYEDVVRVWDRGMKDKKEGTL